MAKKKSVLFVCTGNTCRSPMAEGLFHKAVEERDDYEVFSAGVAAYPGSAMSRETQALLESKGVQLETFRSQPVDEAMLERATHVFAMTREHLHALVVLHPEYEDKFYLACEFADIPGAGIGRDVPDPIGQGPAAYDEVGKTLEIAIPSLIAFMDQTWQG
ncbi:MAG: low molecular weight protein arginine phosphatase [Verrucomicrobiales bacterium]